jgi:hypothetical protein
MAIAGADPFRVCLDYLREDNREADLMFLLSMLQASTAIALAACCGGVYSPPLIIISLIF